jgi:WD40 repeat protein
MGLMGGRVRVRSLREIPFLYAPLTVVRQGDWAAHVAYAPDGSLVASDDRDGIRLLEPGSGRVVRELAASGDMAFSPDAKWLVTTKPAITAWNTASWQPEKIASPSVEVDAVRFLPGSSLIAWIDGRGGVELWDLARRRPVARLVASPGESVGAVIAGEAIELVGSGAAKAKGRLFCQIGLRRLPFEACEERFLRKGLLARAFRGERLDT